MKVFIILAVESLMEYDNRCYNETTVNINYFGLSQYGILNPEFKTVLSIYRFCNLNCDYESTASL